MKSSPTFRTVISRSLESALPASENRTRPARSVEFWMTDPRKLRRTLRSRTNFAEAKKTNDEISPFYRIRIGRSVRKKYKF
jgi:hypothetical protein